VSYLGKSDVLWSELQAIAQDEGLHLYDIERYGAQALRVFVSKSSAESRTTSDDCSRLCRRLINFFMVEGDRLGVGTEPEIEVSSPGVNRHLRLREHFESAIGERVKLGVRGEVRPVDESSPVEEMPAVKVGGLLGTLDKVDTSSLILSDERTKKAWKVPFEQVSKANVEFKF
jgi:ribosome maturation factor RimP